MTGGLKFDNVRVQCYGNYKKWMCYGDALNVTENTGIRLQNEKWEMIRAILPGPEKIHFSNQQIGIALEEYSKGML